MCLTVNGICDHQHLTGARTRVTHEISFCLRQQRENQQILFQNGERHLWNYVVLTAQQFPQEHGWSYCQSIHCTVLPWSWWRRSLMPSLDLYILWSVVQWLLCCEPTGQSQCFSWWVVTFCCLLVTVDFWFGLYVTACIWGITFWKWLHDTVRCISFGWM